MQYGTQIKKPEITLVAPQDVMSTGKLLKTEQSKSRVWCTRQYHSSKWAFYHFAIIMILLIFLAYSAYSWQQGTQEFWFVAAQFMVLSIVVFEITGRIYLIGMRFYFTQIYKVIDTLVVLIWVVALLLGIIETDSRNLACSFGQVLLLGRQLAQYIRLTILICNQRKVQNVLNTIIDFGKLAEDSAIMDNSNLEKVTEDHSNFSGLVLNKIPALELENDEQPSCIGSPHHSDATISINDI